MASFKELQVVVYVFLRFHHFHWITKLADFTTKPDDPPEGVCFRDFCPDDFREIVREPSWLMGNSLLGTVIMSLPKVWSEGGIWLVVPLEAILCVCFFCLVMFLEMWNPLPVICTSEIYMFEILIENCALSTVLWHNLEKKQVSMYELSDCKTELSMYVTLFQQLIKNL